jgi:hypothetical protein
MILGLTVLLVLTLIAMLDIYRAVLLWQKTATDIGPLRMTFACANF